MLVLTRKQMETIQIGDNITITILRMKGQAVRVGIEAPRDVRVVRGELERFEEAPALAPVNEATEAVSEQPTTEVVEFRFQPAARMRATTTNGRGPLSAFLGNLHTEGCVVEPSQTAQ